MAKHKLDQLFAEKLEGFSSSPTPSAWEQIEDQLDRKRAKTFWAWAGIAATAALILASSWFILKTATEPSAEIFEYADAEIENTTMPQNVVYVPIYIYTVVEKPAIQQPNTTRTEVTEPLNPATNIVIDKPVLVADNAEISPEQPEIITLEEVPDLATEEILLASAELPIEEETVKSQKPVTIIYKQGEPANESNFTKALKYMEEVRMGEKKLVNFEKLRENFRSKFRSEEGVDTK